jgi:processive 1,2-diacylglycerol beta-glucosyltransferase
MNRRILILSASYGEGHNAAARALAAGFDRTCGPDTAKIVDAFALASPRIDRISRRLYLRLINDAPRVWSRVYGWLDQVDLVRPNLGFFRREIRLLAELIAREQPAAICCTYPLYPFFLEEVERQVGSIPPVFNVVTDSISIHSLWWRARCDGWFLPNADSADVLLRAGVPPAQVHVCGFPVPSFFADHAGIHAPTALDRNTEPQVLHLVHSGKRNAEDIARALMLETDWQITCAVGRDERMRRRLSRLALNRPFPTRVLGWTDQIPRLLMTHHAVVSKAGGATTQEAIAAHCPMIVSQIVPGQEEGNYELLRRHGVGALATTPGAVLTALRAAFADQGRLWHDWRRALATLATPRAADDIAREVIDLVASGAAHAPSPQRALALFSDASAPRPPSHLIAPA